MKDIHSPNLVGISSWGPKIWPHEYLISPTEIIVNWPNSYEPGHENDEMQKRKYDDVTLQYSLAFTEWSNRDMIASCNFLSLISNLLQDALR